MVTAMHGGAADKAGNHYEDLWVAWRVAQMLEGEVGKIRLEPPGIAGTGIELEVTIEGVVWGEQTKSGARNWTINRLISNGCVSRDQDSDSRSEAVVSFSDNLGCRRTRHSGESGPPIRIFQQV